MAEESKFSSDTAPDVLHTHAVTHMAAPPSEAGTETLHDVAEHPNTSTKTLGHMYKFAMGKTKPNDPELMSTLLEHKNFPPALAEDFALKHSADPDPDHQDIATASGVEGTNPEIFENVAHGLINNPEVSRMPSFKNLRPEFYMNILKDRKPYALTSENRKSMEDQHQDSNNRTDKIDQIALHGLTHTNRHTPKSLDDTVNMLSSSKIKDYDHSNNHWNDEGWDSSVHDFVAGRKDLTKEHLDKLFDAYTGRSHKDWSPAVKAIISHPNADPTLVSKVAKLSSSTSSAAKNNRHVSEAVEAALSNPVLPDPVRLAATNSIASDKKDKGRRDEASAILNNPHVTPKEVVALHNAGYRDALNHPKMPPEEIHKWWSSSGKSTDDARHVLEAKALPPSVLSEIVGHKNQGVAIEALKHPNVDESVLKAALSRKARDVNEAARLHPLVAAKEIKNGVLSGKMRADTLLFDPEAREAFDKLPENDQKEIINHISGEHKGMSLEDAKKKLKSNTEEYFKVKRHLLNSDLVSSEDKAAHVNDIVNHFQDLVPHNARAIFPRSYGRDEEIPDSRHAIKNLRYAFDTGKYPAADEAILKHPGMLESLSEDSHEARDKWSQGFLSRAVDKIKEHSQAGTQTIDSLGNPGPFDGEGALHHVARAQNLPLESFDKITSDPNFFNDSKKYQDETGNGFTVMDRHYGELSDADKAARFGRIAAHGPGGLSATASSLSAPDDTWRNAWQSMAPKDQYEWAKENNIDNVATPDIREEALMGRYNSNVNNVNDNMLMQNQVLEGLDPSDPSDRDLLLKFYENQRNLESDNSARAQPEDMSSRIHSGFLNGDLGDQIVQRVAPFEPSAAAKLAMRKTYEDKISHNDKSFGSNDKQKAENDQRSKEAAAYMQQAAAYGTEGLEPDQANDAIANFWQHALRHSEENRYGDETHDLLSKIAGVSSKDSQANGNLDFLADIPGREGEQLKLDALKQNLLSPAKRDDAEAKGLPFETILSSISDVKRARTIQEYAQKPGSMKASHIEAIVSNLTPSSLNPAFSNRMGVNAIPAEQMAQYTESAKGLVTAAALHPDSSSLLSKLASKLLDSPSSKYSRGAPIKPQKIQLVSDIMDHIQSSTLIPPEQKLAAAFRFYRGVPEDFRKASTEISLEKKAVKDRDVNALLEMSEYGASDNVMSAISQIMTQPDKLTLPQISTATTLLGRPQTDVTTSKRIIGAFDQKISKMDPMAPEAIASKKVVMANMNKSISFGGADEAIKKNVLALDTVQKYLQDPSPAVRKSSATNLRLMSRSKGIPFSRRVDAFVSLPSDPAAYDSSKTYGSHEESDFANNPEVVENSTEGWKLDALADNASVLNKQNSSILVNRAIDALPAWEARKSKGGAPSARFVLQSLTKNPATSSDDVVRLSRAMGQAQLDLAISDMSSRQGENNLAGTHAPALMKERLNQVDQLSDSPETKRDWIPSEGPTPNIQPRQRQKYEPEHIKDLLTGMKSAARVIAGSAYDEDVPGMANATAEYSSAIERMTKHANDIAGHYENMGQSGKGEEMLPYSSENIQDLLRVPRTILNAGMTFDREDSMNILAMIKASDRIVNVMKVHGSKEVPVDVRAGVMKDWISKADNLTSEDWNHTMRSIPHAPFFVTNRSQIGNDILDNVDIPKMLAQDPEMARKHISEWFSKLDAPAIQKHGRSLAMEVSKEYSKAKDSEGLVDQLDNILPYVRDSISLEDIRSMIKDNPEMSDVSFYSSAMVHGAGGPNVIHEALAKHSDNINVVQDAMASPSLDHASAEKAWNALQGLKLTDTNNSVIIKKAIENKFAPSNLVENIARASEEYTKRDSPSAADFVAKLMEHPNLPKPTFDRIFKSTSAKYGPYFTANGKFHPALTNSKYGGELFRSLPVKVPPTVPEVDENKVVKSATGDAPAAAIKQSTRLKDAMNAVTPAGMTWAEFKRVNPKMENYPEVKQVFMKKNNKPVFPEDFVAAQKEHDANTKRNGFHLTFSEWSGFQRHNPSSGPNLVVQVNNSEESEKQLAANPKLWALYQMLLRNANGISGQSIGAHPTTPQMVGWSRVDTSSGDKGWVVEEFQSDFAQKFRKNLRHIINQNPGGLQVDGHRISADELKGYMPQIDKALQGYQGASLNAIIQSAKMHGVKKLFVHGSGVRGHLSGAPNEDLINKNVRRIYDEYPESQGFHKVDYTDYPNASDKTLSALKQKNMSTHAWALDLGKKKT